MMPAISKPKVKPTNACDQVLDDTNSNIQPYANTGIVNKKMRKAVDLFSKACSKNVRADNHDSTVDTMAIIKMPDVIIPNWLLRRSQPTLAE